MRLATPFWGRDAAKITTPGTMFIQINPSEEHNQAKNKSVKIITNSFSENSHIYQCEAPKRKNSFPIIKTKNINNGNKHCQYNGKLKTVKHGFSINHQDPIYKTRLCLICSQSNKDKVPIYGKLSIMLLWSHSTMLYAYWKQVPHFNQDKQGIWTICNFQKDLRNLPNNQQYQRDNPQCILIAFVLRNWSGNTPWRRISLANPFKLGSDQKHKSKKKSRDKSSNMSKVVNMWKDSNC